MNTSRNSENLDKKLSSASQTAIREIVHSLPEDTLSMAWRSSLNERIRAEAETYRPKKRFAWFAAPAAGIAVAACLTVLVVFHGPNSADRLVVGPGVGVASTQTSGKLATGLFDTYRQESASHEIVGAGPDPSSDSGHVTIADATSTASDSSEVDSDSL